MSFHASIYIRRTNDAILVAWRWLKSRFSRMSYSNLIRHWRYIFQKPRRRGILISIVSFCMWPLHTYYCCCLLLEVEFLKPVVNTPPGVLLGNLIGIPRKRIHIRKSGQLLLYLTVNGARSIRACPKKWAFHTGKSPLVSRCICILDPEKFHNPPPNQWRL